MSEETPSDSPSFLKGSRSLLGFPGDTNDKDIFFFFLVENFVLYPGNIIFVRFLVLSTSSAER